MATGSNWFCLLDAGGKTEMGIEIINCANSEFMFMIVTINLSNYCEGNQML